MRYPKDHKEASRQRLVELGGRHAKAHGFTASGMATLAASAGVTTGALYKHFDGKAGLFTALIQSELERTAQKYAAVDPLDDAAVHKALIGYLSMQHLRHPEEGCALPSLTPEITRADDETKTAYQEGLLRIHAKMQRLTSSSEAAWALMAQNVGAVMLARAIPDEKIQREILAALRKSGGQLVSDARKNTATNWRAKPSG